MGLFGHGARAGLAQSKPPLKCVHCGHHVLKTNHLAMLTHFYMATPTADAVFLLAFFHNLLHGTCHLHLKQGDVMGPENMKDKH